MHQTELCNLALAKLGSFTISSIDENSAEARHCKINFELCRQSLLRDFDWNFATHQVELAEIADAASFGFNHAYALPSDYLRALSFDGIHSGTKQKYWKIASGRLYTDQGTASNAKLIYVRDVEDCTEWDSVFCSAFVWYLAAAICPSIKQDPQLAISLLQAGQAFLSDAKGTDTQEDGLKIIRGLEYSQYQRAREGWYGGSAGGYWGAPWMFQDFGPPGNA